MSMYLTANVPFHHSVRIPWVLLFLISLGGAAKQYDQYGYVSPNQAFMILATGLYINASVLGSNTFGKQADSDNLQLR